MEISQYLGILKKNLWLIALACLVVGGGGILWRSQQPEQYAAETTLVIGGFVESANPDESEIRTSLQLVQTYAALATSYDVLQGAVDALDLPLTPIELRESVSVSTVPNTSLFKVIVVDEDSSRAAEVADVIAQQLVDSSPASLSVEEQRLVELANAQVNRLEQQLLSSSARLEVVDAQLDSALSTERRGTLTVERNDLVDQLNQASATIAEFTQVILSIQERSNSISILEHAQPSREPIGISITIVSLASVAAGAVLGIGLALLRGYLDDTLQTSEHAQELLGVPVLGVIPWYGRAARGGDNHSLITHRVPPSVLESYRTLRTNLLFTADRQSTEVFIVTSPDPSDGKSLTAANLAISLAMAGIRVLLIDADLRKSTLHGAFGLKNTSGLATILSRNGEGTDGAARITAVRPEILNADRLFQTVHLDHDSLPGSPRAEQGDSRNSKLKVLTSGILDQDPTEILGSSLMGHLIEALRTSGQLDVVIIDTPPSLVVADSEIIAAVADAKILMVVRAGRTKRRIARRAKERFTAIGKEVSGVVLNGANLREDGYYGGGRSTYYSKH